MARSKPKNIRPVKNLAEANQALAEIGELKRRITLIETGMNAAIDAARAAAELEASPLQTEIARIEAGLAAFGEFEKGDLFKEKRSYELDFGAIGFRKSSQIKPKARHTWAMVLGLLKEMKFPAAIRTKEEVNKDELATWPAERLDLVGARRVPQDVFWYEVNADRIADKE